jgi:DNA-binding HxlR family transcriptional regulator
MAQDTGIQGNIISAPASVARMVEDIVGCKWSLAVLAAIRKDIARPGAIRRSLAGISTKVLNERLAKMLRYGLLVKQIYPEVPPRVEYRLTPFGERFVVLLDQIEALQAQVDAAGTDAPGPKP